MRISSGNQPIGVLDSLSFRAKSPAAPQLYGEGGRNLLLFCWVPLPTSNIEHRTSNI
jgi:hypothetical protein